MFAGSSSPTLGSLTTGSQWHWARVLARSQKPKLSVIRCGHQVDGWPLCPRLCAREISLESVSAQTQQKSFGWEYEIGQFLCRLNKSPLGESMKSVSFCADSTKVLWVRVWNRSVSVQTQQKSFGWEYEIGQFLCRLNKSPLGEYEISQFLCRLNKSPLGESMKSRTPLCVYTCKKSHI